MRRPAANTKPSRHRENFSFRRSLLASRGRTGAKIATAKPYGRAFWSAIIASGPAGASCGKAPTARFTTPSGAVTRPFGCSLKIDRPQRHKRLVMPALVAGIHVLDRGE